MNQPHPDSENALELRTIELFKTLDWTVANCYDERVGENSTLGRTSRQEVVLIPQLKTALTKLNPDLPAAAINLAIEELTRSRSTLSLENANREIYQLLKDGVKVSFQDRHDQEIIETVKVIDWNNPSNNSFFLASQFWICGEIYTKRTDLLGFINGLPLIFIELKRHHQRLELAYKNNLRDYKQTIPQLFWYNAFIILSNGSKSRIGSITSTWEHFSNWKKINSEGEEGIISLETIIKGTCNQERSLDIIENFTFFYTAKGELIKIFGKNHQFLGVNQAVTAVSKIKDNQGKLGVFWHTQGSGKSYSMVFFAQKILRKIPGNWTFLIITDREDLDKQIYQNFAYVGAVTEPEKNVRASSAEHLKQLLKEDHRYIFTLIQKFRVEKGQTYPQLSPRSNIIVVVDEAHRSQYDTFALNLRNALPNAAFIGFTGTPLMAGEEKTREVFGDYVSIYNFRQSVEDKATVPLYYENRIPELQLTNDQLNDKMQQIIENSLLDQTQESLLERQCSREYNLIVREDRLDKIAVDIVTHFLSRGFGGKAMVISIDRFTTVKMYDKVNYYWQQQLKELETQLQQPNLTEFELKQLQKKIQYLKETDMAVIISASQNEVDDFQHKGLDITPHRYRLVNESPGLDDKFKDPKNPLRIVFVCAMWITGFDAPSCSTVYLDKPMKNHTLMQTIARANRVFKDKVNGLIVDYIGVFRNLQAALAIYGSGAGGGIEAGDTPVKPKNVLLEELSKAVTATQDFCRQQGIDLNKLNTTQDAFERAKVWDEAVEAILVKEETKKLYFALCANVTRLYKAILPDKLANEFSTTQMLLEKLALKIRQEIPETDISGVIDEVENLLDASIVAGEFIIPEYPRQLIDLEQLQHQFQTGYKHTAAAKLKGTIECQLEQMLEFNKTRLNYFEKYQKMIEEYNSDARNVDWFFNQLVKLAQQLKEEETRAITEHLTQEELAIFDLLTKCNVNLSQQEEKQVKQIAQELLNTLKQEKLVIDWKKRQQTRASVEVAIGDMLEKLPQSYSNELYQQKCQQIYQHIFDCYVV
ncbi:type I site-specific deoxyribonuclease HsdR [Chondrocystis sp. NIES-4102]|nr:type I site-specific deoxyribonuclease HsdR [Chondrocystis sp. NIES-4102]